MTPADVVVPMNVRELQETATPYVLESTPPVLSVGRRCMRVNQSFLWLNLRMPFFIRDDGLVTRFRVIDDIPYLICMLIPKNIITINGVF